MIDAELFSIAYELTQILPALKGQKLSFRLNHTSLLNAILLNQNVPPEKYNDIFAALLDYIDNRVSKLQLHSILISLLESSKQSAYNLMETLTTEIPLGNKGNKPNYSNGNCLRNLLKGHNKAGEMARNALDEIEQLVAFAQNLGVGVS